jgi:hypothetical protein
LVVACSSRWHVRAYSVEASRRYERLGAFLFGGLVGWRQVAAVEIVAVTLRRRPQQICVSIDELVEGIVGPAKKVTSVSGDENRSSRAANEKRDPSATLQISAQPERGDALVF